MDEIQGELFEKTPITVEKNTTGQKMMSVEISGWICPICKGTGYTKGTRCVCSED